jgi:hypothetical protein
MVLEEMPAFPAECESTLLSKLYQSAPWTAKLHKTAGEESVGKATREEEPKKSRGHTPQHQVEGRDDCTVNCKYTY